MKTIKMIVDVPIDVYAMWMARGIKLGTLLNEVQDEIKAEIEDFEEELFHRPNTDYTDYAAVRHCVEIIDRYTKDGE